MNTAALGIRFAHLAPEMILLGTTLLIVLWDSFYLEPNSKRRDWFVAFSVLACAGAALFGRLHLWDLDERSYGDLLRVDNFSISVGWIVLLGTSLSLLLSEKWLSKSKQSSGGYFALVLISATGMLLMVSAADMVLLFLGLELTSIPIYILCASDRDRAESVEAGLKYLILGSLGTAMMLFGMAFVYGACGSLVLEDVRNWALGGSPGMVGSLGVIFFLAGLLFKSSVVPFHMWTPDVYEGAPTPVTAFMAVAVKAVAFAVLLRVFGGEVVEHLSLQGVLWGLAAATMILGNVAALAQKSVKRMLAYSSIGHAGYLLLGVLAANEAGAAAIVFYILAYTIMTIASFGVVSLLSESGTESLEFQDLAGLGQGRPWMAVVMTLAMLSLAGMPPTVGFIGKFYLFRSALESGYIVLAALGVLTSAVSLGYYLRVILVMWFEEGEPNQQPMGGPAVLALSFVGIVMLLAGLMPTRLIALAISASPW